MLYLRITHVVACAGSSILVPKECCGVWLLRNRFTVSPADGHLAYFQLLAILGIKRL